MLEFAVWIGVVLFVAYPFVMVALDARVWWRIKRLEKCQIEVNTGLIKWVNEVERRLDNLESKGSECS